MARTANKTANDMLVVHLTNGLILDASEYMFGHLISTGAVSVAGSVNDDGSAPESYVVINIPVDGLAGGETLGIQSFTLDTPKIYLVATVTSGEGVLVLTGARNTPVTQPDTTLVYPTVFTRAS